MKRKTSTHHAGLISSASECMSLVDLLNWRAVAQPEQQAYTFLTDGENEKLSLTYNQLDQRARAIATQLQMKGAVGMTVLLLYPPTLDYIAAFFGCLYAGAIAVPLYPPRLNKSLHRIETVASDAQARIALTTSGVLSRTRARFARNKLSEGFEWLATDTISLDLANEWRYPNVTSSTLAFLQYTSGSTSAPKGVMVTHGNLLHNERMIQTIFGQTEKSVTVGWLPFYHDMGLIGNVIQPLYTGNRCILMPPMAFLQRPFRWLQAISRYKATTSGGPNFAYDLCVNNISGEQRASLDLSAWSVAFNGAEPISAQTLERFSNTFAESGFRRDAFSPCYGLAEATLIISGKQNPGHPVIKSAQARELENNRIADSSQQIEGGKLLVSSGKSLPDQKVLIVDPESRTECAQDQVGEIWVSGPSVAQGYWNRAEDTELTFRAYLSSTGEGPFLRTGDLGFLSDGELFVTGRLKDLIIIRGLNHYPQDIEITVQDSHASLRRGCGAAFSVELQGEERLVVVQEVQPHCRETNQIIDLICQAVAENHELQLYAVVLIKPGTIPKTTSGKIQRLACRSEFLANSLNVVAEWTRIITPKTLSPGPIQISSPESLENIESWLAALLAAKLGLDVSDIDVNQPVWRYGLDSLTAINLIHSIENALAVMLPISSLFEGSSIADIAAQAMNQSSAARPVVTANDDFETIAEHPLSAGQKALWLLHQLNPASSAYNIAAALRIEGNLDAAILQRTFQMLADRHAALRANFITLDADPAQRVREQANICFKQEDASTWSGTFLNDFLSEEAQRPFNLEQDSLLRLTLLKRSEQEHVLLFNIHHIIADFWSLAVLIEEFSTIYQREKAGEHAHLPALTLRYTDYARWQAEMLAGSEGNRLWEYWRDELAGELPTLNLPVKRSQPSYEADAGASHAFKISSELALRIEAVARSQGATLYMTLLAAFQVLLYRYTGQKEILVGSPAAGRGSAAFAGIIGYFVNLLVLRAHLSASLSFEAFLAQVRRTVLSALAHQDYPFALLVERLQPVREPGMSPLVRAVFALQKSHVPGGDGLAAFALGESGAETWVGDLRLESIAIQRRSNQFDLCLMMAESDRHLRGSFQYNSELFSADTIERMTQNFQTLLESIALDPQQPISLLPLLTKAEQHELLVGWNDTKKEYPKHACIHHLFQACAERAPDDIALVFEDDNLSYRELDARANQLAHYLRDSGVGPDMIVGICMERSIETIVGLLGILKAGGAYLPLDPGYPEERLSFMLEDAQARVLITRQSLVKSFSAYGGRIIRLDADWPVISRNSRECPTVKVDAENLAYVTYTSGSTGLPKGVQIVHRSVARLLLGVEYVDLGADKIIPHISPLAFDASTFEIWGALLHGARCVMMRERVLSASSLRRVIDQHSVNTMWLTASLFNAVVDEGAEELRGIEQLLIGGEALSSAHVRRAQEALQETKIINGYGPTESTTFTCCYRIPQGISQEKPIPIGIPIANTRVYVLDENMQPVPATIAGELCIAGDGLARGYLNRPALTAEKFAPNPFDEPGGRLYKTGDLARYNDDGTIEFLGRVDHQVKIRGYRIEPGEIEAALSQHAAVRECAVIIHQDAHRGKRLVAYVSSKQEAALTVEQLQELLKQKLPEYMMPAAFVLLETLPLTANGKLDRAALSALSPLESACAFVAPRNPVEQSLADMWASILGVERVGVHDNFFALGGHSLLAARLISRVRKSFDVEIQLQTFFEEPTIATLSRRIESSKAKGAKPRKPALSAIPRNEHLAEMSSQGSLIAPALPERLKD